MYPNRNHAGHRTAALAALMLAGSLSLAACGEEIATDDAQQVEAPTPAPDATRFEPGGPGRPATHHTGIPRAEMTARTTPEPANRFERHPE
ncbi:hypothetical protein [Ornithinimicrobium cerasi]|uniref:Uncharacterized protein n=1 Tax=Ornithinimicrobium cerasi TaxID=2248773 RepID=A0A285VTT7_9MICO|nr:hypothetical protein [Ornithinimicrobium cerasi]SOC57297.1 hypothetical protein SAMN05421879_11212 [Ornithinimicrobium cerasi]